MDSCNPSKLDPGLAATNSTPSSFSVWTIKSEPGRLVTLAGTGGGTAPPASRASWSGVGSGRSRLLSRVALVALAMPALWAPADDAPTAIVAAPVAAPLRNARRSTTGRSSSFLVMAAPLGRVQTQYVLPKLRMHACQI